MTEFIFKQLIDGEWVDAAEGGVWELINPATEDVIAPMPFGDADDAQAALDAAAAAFPAWAKQDALRARRDFDARGGVDSRAHRRAGRDHDRRIGQAAARSDGEWVDRRQLVRVVRGSCQASLRAGRPGAPGGSPPAGDRAAAGRGRHDHGVELPGLQRGAGVVGGAGGGLHGRRASVGVHAALGDAAGAGAPRGGHPAGRGQRRSTASRRRWARRCSKTRAAARFSSRAARASASC